MRAPLVAIAALCGALPASAAPLPAPYAPRPGTLFIVGGGPLPEAVGQKFIELAGGEKAKIVIIPTASELAGTLAHERKIEFLRKARTARLTLLHTRSRDEANDPEFSRPLADATGVWFTGGKQQRLADTYLGTQFEQRVDEVLARGGVVGGTSSGAAVMSALMIRFGMDDPDVGPGFNLLAGTVIDQHFIQRRRQERLMRVLSENPGLFGLGIDEGTALVVRGRRGTVVGNSQVVACLAPSKLRPAKTQSLAAGDEIDLVAWSRAALARAGENTALAAQTPEVPRGTLVIVGGGSTTEAISRRFIEAAGGADAPLVVISTAQGDKPPPEERDTVWLRRAGARRIVRLHPNTPAEANAPRVLTALREASGVWFTGGRQWRLVDALSGTAAERALHEVLDRGGVIGGTSAGATIQGGYLVRGNPLGNTEMMCEGYERGLGFLPGAAIDQHFTQRRRHADMTALRAAYPQLVGLGIDESTAVIVAGHELEVVGEHHVAVYDGAIYDGAASQRQLDYTELSPGDRYDFKTKALAHEASATSER